MVFCSLSFWGRLSSPNVRQIRHSFFHILRVRHAGAKEVLSNIPLEVIALRG